MKSKHLLLMLLLALMAPWAAMGQTTFTIGDGTSYSPTGSGNPSATTNGAGSPTGNTYFYNSTAQFIYTAEELGTAKTINSVAFYHNDKSLVATVKIYLFHTTESTVNTSSYVTSGTPLYTGTNITLGGSSAGWQTFTLETPFEYNGTDNLLVVVCRTKRSDGGTPSYLTALAWQYTSTSENYRYMMRSNDTESNVALSNTTTAYVQSYYRPNIQIEYELPSSCEKPDTFEHSNVTHNSATLTWSGGSGTYNVEVKGGAWTDWTEILHETTLTTTNLNLQPITAYQARVQSVCTGENSGWKSTSFATECGPVGIGYQCGFEGPNTGGTTSYPLPACWTRTGTSTNYPYAYNSSSYARTDSYSLYFDGSSSTNAIAQLPEIEGGVNGKRLTFYASVESTSYNSLSVGYMDGSTFKEVQNITPTATSYTLYEVDFANIAGNPTNMAIKFNCSSTWNYYIAVDDLELQETPPCADMQVQASTITATATAYDAATVTWTGAGAATQWKVQCSQDNTFATVDKEVVANTTTANITGLTAEKTYYVRIAPFCTENSEYNPWSSNKSFSTPESCPAPVLAAATNPTAHGATLNWTGSSETYNVMAAEVDVNTAFETNFESGSLPSDFTTTTSYPWTVVANTHSGAYCAKSGNFDVDNSTSDMVLEVTLTSDMTLTFSAKVSSESGWDKAYFSIDGTAQTSPNLNGISGNGSWINYSYPLAAGTHTLRWYYTKDTESYDYDDCFYVDDIKISSSTVGSFTTVATGITENTYVMDNATIFDPETTYQVKVVGACPWTSEETESNIISFTTTSSCETPSNLQESEVTANSAKITWNTHGLTNFNLRYSSDGGSSWTTVENVSSPYTFPDNLTANKEYQVQAQGICTAGTTEWSVARSFWTECDAFTVDMQHSFTQYFDESTFPRCWDNPIEVINSSNRQWTRSSLNHTATSGSGSAYSGYYGPIYLMMPDLAIANGTTDVKLNFWARLVFTSDYDGTTAKSSVVLIDGNTETELWTYDDVANITALEDLWKDYSINLSAYKGQTISLAFKYVGTNDHGWYIDDVEVAFDPTCFPVSNLSYSDVTNHSATIIWNKGTADQDTWQVKYNRDADFDPDIEGEAIPGGKCYDTTYTFDKTLFATSHYYVYVRANCGDVDGPSTWVKTDFTTLEATPAPSSFTASNLASQQVDLKWVEGGGDGETSWDLYYVKSTTAPTPPTASTPATETVTTMPTPADPYVLKNLDPESTYYIWVRSNYDWNSTTSHSDWVALTGDSFTTLNNCPTPNNVEIDANSITAVEAIVTWVGSMDVSSYTVEYGEEGTYSVNETVDFSGLTTAGYSSEGVLPDGWKRYNSNAGYMPHVSNKASCGDIDEFGDDNNYLLMTQNKSSNQYLYAIMPQISNLASLEFKYVYESTGTGVLSVGYVTDNTGYSTYQVLQTPTKSGTVQTFKLNATDIATINANNGYVTFRYEGTSTTYYSVGIDDIVYKGGTYTPGLIETKPATEQQITLTGLTPNKTYNVRVKSDCTSAEWSTYASFTTLPDGTKVFTNAATDGKWSTAGNWSPVNAPALTDDVILRADATIENGCVATANSIAPSGNTLIIADGGQLQTNTAVTATVKKNITGYGDAGVGTNNGYYLIANPINTSIGNATTYGMATSDGLYDLYQFNANPGASDSLEWRNYKANSFYIANGKGYLYANKNNVELTFTGNVRANNAAVGFGATFAGDWQFKGWNLFGNPFVCNAYLVDAETGGSALPYYKMNSAGNNVESVSGGAIAPMEGIFYEASAATNVYFTRTNPAVTSTGPKGNLNILVSNSNTRGSSVIDNAIISFGNPNTLGKLNLFACDARVFIPQDGKDYAVAYAESNVGEMPLNFKAEKNGAYTLSFTAEEVGFSYLHLIDNMTGADIDLLAGASTGSATYTFNAKTTDYASRFRLVFATGSSVEDDNFGFINGSGNLCIFGIEGTATLQVIDVTGRILSSETFSGSYEKGLNAAPGVYVMRLINGNEVKTQKIVVR